MTDEPQSPSPVLTALARQKVYDEGLAALDAKGAVTPEDLMELDRLAAETKGQKVYEILASGPRDLRSPRPRHIQALVDRRFTFASMLAVFAFLWVGVVHWSEWIIVGFLIVGSCLWEAFLFMRDRGGFEGWSNARKEKKLKKKIKAGGAAVIEAIAEGEERREKETEAASNPDRLSLPDDGGTLWNSERGTDKNETGQDAYKRRSTD